MKLRANRIIGSALVLFGLAAAGVAQVGPGNAFRLCTYQCEDCGVIMQTHCVYWKYCCVIIDCELCAGAGTCCPTIPGICCVTGYGDHGSPWAACGDCDPV